MTKIWLICFTAMLLTHAMVQTEADAAAVTLADGAVFSDCPTCPEMVVIPPGSFVMGHEGGVNDERYEGPPHKVTISYAFAFGRLEVTTAQFTEFVNATGYQAGTDCRMWTGESVDEVPGKDWRDPGYDRPPRDDDPVACVSWYDAKAYVAWLADATQQPYRLPTEAEWEYVAHGGEQTAYSWGENPDFGCAVANYYDQAAKGLRPWDPVACNDGHRIVAPVGSLAPNPFGVHDITGNVWEWAEDCYLVPYGVQPTDGSPYQVEGPCEKRVVRGGAWHSRATWQRPTFRGRDTEDFVTQVFGIRVVRDLSAE
jgi:formylglycine-generating enzyme required for sulfatase activity